MPSGIDFSAAFAARDEAYHDYYYDVLVARGASPDPEDTMDELMIELIASYQAELVAAGAPYDDFTPEDEYQPSAQSPVDYVTYLGRIVATIPGS